MRRSFSVLIAAGLAALVSCGPDRSVGGGDILDNFLSARVVDDSDRPLVAARAALRSRDESIDSLRAAPGLFAEATTDSNGVFRFGKIPSGAWTVEVRKDGIGRRLDLVVAGGKEFDAGTLVARPSGSLTGTVMLPRGAKSAWVALPGTGRGVRTDSLGRFQFDSLLPGPVRIEAVAFGAGVVGLDSSIVPSRTSTDVGTLAIPKQAHEIVVTLDPASVGVSLGGTATNLPIPVRLDTLVDFSTVRKDGADLRALKLDGTPLALQFEEWLPDSGKALVWVGMDSVRATGPTGFRLVWGDTSIGKPSSAAVFGPADGWMGVWHLGTSLSDAAGANALTEVGTVVASAAVGRGRLFPTRQSAYLQAQPGSNFDVANDLYVESWIRSDSLGANYDAVVARGDAGFRLQRGGASDRMTFALRDSLNSTDSTAAFVEATGTTSFADGALHHVVGMRRGDTLLVYMDGRRDGAKFFSGLAANGTKPLQIGRNTSASRSWHGLIDEVRVSRMAHSDEWVRLSYEVQNPSGRILKAARVR